MHKSLISLAKDVAGATTVEYGLIAAGIMVAILAVLISTARHLPS